MGCIRKLLKVKLSLVKFLKYNVICKSKGLFLPYKRSFFDINRKAKIWIEQGGKFSFNANHGNKMEIKMILSHHIWLCGQGLG